MKQSAKLEAMVFVLLVLSGIGLRLTFEYIPNFAPVAAISLFAGFFFQRRAVAICVPLLIMAVSDSFIGGYHPGMMLVVYVMLALPVAARGLVRRLMSADGIPRTNFIRSVVGLAGCGVVSSLLFFAFTNLGHWSFYHDYPRTLEGLCQCYIHALPFYRYTLCGDCLFAVTLFGIYGLLGVRLTAHGQAASA